MNCLPQLIMLQDEFDRRIAANLDIRIHNTMPVRTGCMADMKGFRRNFRHNFFQIHIVLSIETLAYSKETLLYSLKFNITQEPKALSTIYLFLYSLHDEL